jgi:hypothetical protein
MTTWKFFIGAGILATGLLLKAGAPIAPIALGLVAAAFLTWRKQRSRAGVKR